MIIKPIGNNCRNVVIRLVVLILCMILPGTALAVKVENQPHDATAWRGSSTSFVFAVVTGSIDGSIWGSGPYTDDSHISTAAVHSGALANGENGLVKIAILPGQSSYTASTSNGVTSQSYGSWNGSYTISRWQL